MRSRFLALVLSIVALAVPCSAASPDTAKGVVVVSANLASRTSLKVSSHVLHFVVTSPGDPTTVAVDFTAAARTASGGEVMLSVEPVREIDGPGGPADVETALTFAGEGDGTTTGTLTNASPSIAARWIGSGLRSGRLVFALRAAASGNYTVPIRFVLSTP